MTGKVQEKERAQLVPVAEVAEAGKAGAQEQAPEQAHLPVQGRVQQVTAEEAATQKDRLPQIQLDPAKERTQPSLTCVHCSCASACRSCCTRSHTLHI